MYIELSFPSTNFRDYLKFRQQHDKLTSQGILGADVPKPKPEGGKLTIIDWHSKQTLWECEAPTPAGFVLKGKEFLVCDELGDEIVSVNSRGEIKQFFSHPLFNYPHDLTNLDNRFLVTSTGLDSILEFDQDGKLLFEWHAVLWGYNKTPTGQERVIDFSKDHRGIRYATLDRTVHINSAVYFDASGKTILTTFFHTGELVLIDKETGRPQVIIDGLDHPHAIHRGLDNTFIFSETGKSRVHILDGKLKIIKTFDNKHGCEWIQDSVFTPNGTILIGDANKTRILEVSYPDFILLDSYVYDHNWKLFKISWDSEEAIENFLESS